MIKPNITPEYIIYKFSKKNQQIIRNNEIMQNTFFLNFIFFSLLFALLLFLIFKYVDKKNTLSFKKNKKKPLKKNKSINKLKKNKI